MKRVFGYLVFYCMQKRFQKRESRRRSERSKQARRVCRSDAEGIQNALVIGQAGVSIGMCRSRRQERQACDSSSLSFFGLPRRQSQYTI